MTPLPPENQEMAELAFESIPWRVTRLETTSDKHGVEIAALQQSDATFTEQIGELKTSNYALKGTMDKLLWALIGLALTIAGSCISAVLAFAH